MHGYRVLIVASIVIACCHCSRAINDQRASAAKAESRDGEPSLPTVDTQLKMFREKLNLAGDQPGQDEADPRRTAPPNRGD
jgi:hypothetical protein